MSEGLHDIGSRADCERLVRAFYGRALADPRPPLRCCRRLTVAEVRSVDGNMPKLRYAVRAAANDLLRLHRGAAVACSDADQRQVPVPGASMKNVIAGIA